MEAAIPLAVEIQNPEHPWDWIKMDVEQVTEKLKGGQGAAVLSFSCTYMNTFRHTYTQFGLLNGQAV